MNMPGFTAEASLYKTNNFTMQVLRLITPVELYIQHKYLVTGYH